MSEKRFIVFPHNVVWDNQLGEVVCRCILEGIGDAENVCQRLNEQQDTIEELKTHNLQHFLEWLVIKGYVTDEPLKDINNVIDCVNKFKEYLTELDKFKERLEVLEDE